MGLFSASTYENDVERATSEQNTKENWSHIMDVCDKAKQSTDEARNYLKAIIKRLNNTDPHIGLQAATLLDACVNNCGKVFHLEVASREFENEYLKLISKVHPKLAKTLNLNLKRWSEEEFKSDTQLILIPTLYSKLVEKGFDFTIETMSKKAAPVSKDPNVVESQEEQDQIAKAIELSLKESEAPKTTSTSLYPSTNLASSSSLYMTTIPKEPKKVRALYDFEAAEDNELTFSSGDIIIVTDDSDPNWWKGSNQKGEGLFPASFVTTDLSIEPEQLLLEKQKKLSQLDEALDGKATASKEPEVTEINEQKIDRLLHLLHEADPTNPEHDTEEMLNLEREVNNMGPLIDSELERVDRKHAQLTKLSSDLVEALNLYHTLMREPQTQNVTKMPPYGYMDMHPTMTFNGMFPPNMPRDMIASMQQQQQQPIPHNQMDNRPYMPHHSGPTSMPPPFSLPPGGLPPPHHPMPPHLMTDDRIPPNTIPTFPNQGMPNYGPMHMQHQQGGFPMQNVGQMQPPSNIHQQNGTPMVPHYPPPPPNM